MPFWGRRKLILEISPDVDALIDDLATEAGCSREDVLRRGLAVMKAARDQKHRGMRHLGFTQEAGVLDVELVGVL